MSYNQLNAGNLFYNANGKIIALEQELHPIPLTLDIVKKLGFEEQEPRILHYFGRQMLTPFLTYRNLRLIVGHNLSSCLFIDDNSYNYIAITYVHELQNAVKYWCGDTLTIED